MHPQPRSAPAVSAGRSTTTIVNRTRGTVVATRARAARDFWTRLVGLMGRRALPAGEGLFFPGTPCVHTCFMRFPIDLIFYDREGVVLYVAQALAPWRVSRYCRGAQGVIELPAGTAQATATAPGDVLDFTG